MPGNSSLPSDLIALGKEFFFDKALSVDGTIACSSCHLPEHAFSDTSPVSKGVKGRSGTRNAPSLLNIFGQSEFFWDGRRKSLVELVEDPLFSPQEHGLENEEQLIHIANRHKQAVLKALGPQDLTKRKVVEALAAFVQNLGKKVSASRFDRYQYRGEREALSEVERRGLSLFVGQAGCSECHSIEGPRAFFSDGKYHFGESSTTLAASLPSAAIEFAALTDSPFKQLALRKDFSALGRFVATKQPNDIGKFRTPSLRNVALTAPYMHDGSVPSLEEAVERELYYRTTKSSRLSRLNPVQRRELVAFLGSLNNEQDANQNSGSKKNN